MKKLGKWTIGGLQGKILNLCMILVTTAITAFAIVVILQLRSLSQMSEKTGIDTNNTIKDMSEESMMEQTERSMKVMADFAANIVDYEFWIFMHELSILGDQAQDVFLHPDQYKETEVLPPSKKNEGEYTLQLMHADWTDTTDAGELSMVRKLANLAPSMKRIVSENREMLLDCYIALPSGYTIAMDDLSGSKYEEDGSVKKYDPTSRNWYKGAVANKRLYFTPAVHSYFYDLDEIAYGMPVYANGKLVCVLEGSTKLDAFREALEDICVGDTTFAILVNGDGQIIYSPYTEGELAIDDELTANIGDSQNDELKRVFNLATSGETGFEPVTVNGKKYYASFSSLEILGGACIFFIAEEEITDPTEELLAEVDNVTKKSLDKHSSEFRTSSWLSLLVVVLLIFNAILVAITFSNKLLKPIALMTKKVEEITGDNLVFEMEDVYRTGDEIEVLARAFGNLSEKTRQYISELVDITAEKERIGAELDVATRIQAAMLPSDFPLFPERKEFDIYATMTPAKEVGGDLYDIFLLDHDHLCMVVGDVAGKGVPASLFMVISKTMLKNRAQMGGSPAEILSDVNNSLFEGNKEKMFVTVWLGILTISTGKLVMANAGHEYPVIRRGDGEYELQKLKNGLVLGVRKNMKYKDVEFTLDRGDHFFMYTDGLPEATNAEGKRLETEGMMAAINRHRDEPVTELLSGIAKEVSIFVGDAPQFDDLTMMIIRYNGSQEA